MKERGTYVEKQVKGERERQGKAFWSGPECNGWIRPPANTRRWCEDRIRPKRKQSGKLL